MIDMRTSPYEEAQKLPTFKTKRLCWWLTFTDSDRTSLLGYYPFLHLTETGLKKSVRRLSCVIRGMRPKFQQLP